MKLILEKTTTLFYFFAISILVLVLVLFYYNTKKVKSETDLVQHTQEVINMNNQVMLDVVNIETGQRGYNLTGSERYLEPYNNGLATIEGKLTSLKLLTNDNASQQLRINSLIVLAHERIALAKLDIDNKKQAGSEESGTVYLEKGKITTDKIRTIIAEINTEEFDLLKQRKSEGEKSNKKYQVIFLSLFALTIVMFVLVLLILRNQNERNKESEVLIASQKLLSKYSLSLIEASLDPLVTINTHGKITDMNEATVNITGKRREELIGSDFFDYFTEQQKAREVYQEVFAKGSVADSPLTLRHKDGKLTDVLFNGSVYKDDKGKVIGVVIVARDVTAQKLLSKYSLSLIEASRDPLFAISPEGKITDTNQATVKITEVSREKLIGSDFTEYFTDQAKAKEGYQEVFAKGFVADFPLTMKDGIQTPVLFNGSVYRDDRGSVLGAVVVARVITEQKRFEKELTEARVAAELATKIAEEAKSNAEDATLIAKDAVKAKQQFLSNMSHEIRTPMNAIIGFTKVVLKTDLTAKQREYLNAIKISGDALIVLINDILDLAKVDAGKMTFEQTAFRMKDSISAMLHLFEAKIQEKNLELETEYDIKIPKVLVGDPVRLHQIILNLVSNAVKFTSKGKITVTVKLLNEDDEKVNIQFSIADSGIGITESKIEKIFENFQQASSSTSRLFGGTGLGLAIVKQLVEAQGGSINVTSVMDQGSVFSFILSFEKTNAEAEPEIDMVELDKEISNIKVLVVEDIALNQLLMKTLLDDFGFERDIAANGKIAIEKLQSKTYDIILMDLQMPEMNGFEATEYIRNNMNSKIPIIALTADVTTVDLAKCKAVGMNDYIAKPVDERLLYSKIIGLVKKPVAAKNLNDNIKIPPVHLKYTDLNYLHHRTKSNPVLMMEMITLYLEQTPSLVLTMKQSLHDKDWHLLHAAVHKMIPSFAIMGMSADFENIAKKVQEYASTQEQTDVIPGLVLQLEQVCVQACKELETEFNVFKNTNQ